MLSEQQRGQWELETEGSIPNIFPRCRELTIIHDTYRGSDTQFRPTFGDVGCQGNWRLKFVTESTMGESGP